jgi:hypothetical protein
MHFSNSFGIWILFDRSKREGHGSVIHSTGWAILCDKKSACMESQFGWLVKSVINYLMLWTGDLTLLYKIVKRAFRPYYIDAPEGYDWYTVYAGNALTLPCLHVAELNWLEGQHVADQFSVSNRVLLAGDAYHTHPPKAGMSCFEPRSTNTPNIFIL